MEEDAEPPVISVFMNDENFVTGGITDINPKIFVQCSDDFGMNFTGNSPISIPCPSNRRMIGTKSIWRSI
jgi:hypothetical protein